MFLNLPFARGGKAAASQKQMESRLEARIGRLPLTGRYHKPPKKVSDDYIITDKVLGSGFNGVVKMATSRSPKGGGGDKFAIKTFRLSGISRDQRTQLDQEVEIFLAADHPHITRLFHVYEGDGQLVMVMECMEGGELFDRVIEKKRFSESDASEAIRQMLLAINYIHCHGIVHRDLKLENFLYDRKGGDHLKLIDFGFSKVVDPNVKMRTSCGTLSYVAPEVLGKSYGKECDMWSLGVISFILLSGYMPFSGSDNVQTEAIKKGKFTMKEDKWKKVSKEAFQFTTSMMKVDPKTRLTAQAALDDPWISQKHTSSPVDGEIVDALRQFGNASKMRRCCLQMMAWSLSNEERATVRQHFLALDQNKQGTITLAELKQTLVDKYHISDEETLQIFDAMDTNNDEEIHYSDFLAAMVSTRIAMHDGMLRDAFQRFDTDNSGYITLENMKEVLGPTFEGEEVATLIKEADQLNDGRISYEEFQAYLQGSPLDAHVQAVAALVDKQQPARHNSWSLQGRLMRKQSNASKGAKTRSSSRTVIKVGQSAWSCFGICRFPR